MCKNTGHRILYSIKQAPTHYMPELLALIQQTHKFPKCHTEHHRPRTPPPYWSSVKSYETPRRKLQFDLAQSGLWKSAKASQWRQNVSWGLSTVDFSILSPWEHFPKERLQEKAQTDLLYTQPR